MSTENPQPASARTGRRWGLWILLLLGAALVVAAIPTVVFWGGSLIGGLNERGGFLIVNSTSEMVEISTLYADGTEVPFFDVPPGESEAPIECAHNTLIARTEDGEEVARHGPFDECGDSDWVIDPG